MDGTLSPLADPGPSPRCQIYSKSSRQNAMVKRIELSRGKGVPARSCPFILSRHLPFRLAAFPREPMRNRWILARDSATLHRLSRHTARKNSEKVASLMVPAYGRIGRIPRGLRALRCCQLGRDSEPEDKAGKSTKID